jgi:hypothetical protein
VQIVWGIESRIPSIDFCIARVEVIKDVEYLQREAINRLLIIWKEYRPEKIYVDSGYGATQVEIIINHAKSVGDNALLKAFKAIEFGGTIPIGGDLVQRKGKKKDEHQAKVRVKTMMVSNFANLMNSGILTLPAFEDDEDGLITDIRLFRLKGIGVGGEPIYGSAKRKGQHKHMAALLAAYARYIYYRELNATPDLSVGYLDTETIRKRIDNEVILDQKRDRTIRDREGLMAEVVRLRNPFSARGRRGNLGRRTSKFI